MGAVAAPPLGTVAGSYRSPLEDAYFYYGLQNPLDASLGARECRDDLSISSF
jgi:hypothetical protein